MSDELSDELFQPVMKNIRKLLKQVLFVTENDLVCVIHAQIVGENNWTLSPMGRPLLIVHTFMEGRHNGVRKLSD